MRKELEHKKPSKSKEKESKSSKKSSSDKFEDPLYFPPADSNSDSESIEKSKSRTKSKGTSSVLQKRTSDPLAFLSKPPLQDRQSSGISESKTLNISGAQDMPQKPKVLEKESLQFLPQGSSDSSGKDESEANIARMYTKEQV